MAEKREDREKGVWGRRKRGKRKRGLEGAEEKTEEETENYRPTLTPLQNLQMKKQDLRDEILLK